jgi:glutamate decarboxylase
VVWEKFCNYFEVEARLVPLEEERYVMTPETARPLIDERTIGLVGILGSTYTGQYEDIQGLNDLCGECCLHASSPMH